MADTPETRPRLRLKVAMLATLTRPSTTTRVVTRSPLAARATGAGGGCVLGGGVRSRSAASVVRPSSSSRSPLNEAASASAAAKSGSGAGRARARPRRRRRPARRLAPGSASAPAASASAPISRLDAGGAPRRSCSGRRARGRSRGSGIGTARGAASVTVAAIADRSGGSGMAWAIVAMRVGSCSASSALEEVGHLGFELGDGRADPLDARLDRSPRRRPSRRRAPPCGRRCARRSPRGSGRSRALDHSRTAATSSSARRRRPAASSAEPVRISSTATFASAAKRVIVSSREALGRGLHGAAEIGHELGRPAGSW